MENKKYKIGQVLLMKFDDGLYIFTILDNKDIRYHIKWIQLTNIYGKRMESGLSYYDRYELNDRIVKDFRYIRKYKI